MNKSPMKHSIVAKSILILGLLALLWLAYSFAKLVSQGTETPAPYQEATQSTAEFSSDPQVLGEVGGAHYLRDMRFEDHAEFERIVLVTQLNRSSILEESIQTPYIEAVLRNGQAYTLELSLADTTQIYSEEGAPENIYSGPRDAQSWASNLIASLSVPVSTEGGQKVILGLTGAKPYRLMSDPENTGNVWLDILK